MIFRFPSLETLRRSLLAGAVPERVATGPAESVPDDSGGVLIRSGGRHSVALDRALAPYGASVSKGNELPDGPARRVDSWLELLPLRPRDGSQPEVSSITLLFEVPRAADFAVLSNELLRLGHDRFAWSRCERDGAGVTYARVVGPPYFTLLRLMDRDNRPGVAYWEQQPGVWVEWGWELSFTARLIVPEGEWRLVRAPDVWTALSEPRFVEVEDAADFVLPAAPRQVARTLPIERLRVPLRLAPTELTGTASLWVVRGPAIVQLEEFVATSSDELLERLSFALIESAGERRVILRSRAGRSAPALAFDADAYRPLADCETLFVPCGRRLVPPVRRGLVRGLFGDDPDELTWLEPTADGGFRPLSIDERAFRPLPDWVDYVLDRDRERLEAWSETFNFDFDDESNQDGAVEDQPRDNPTLRGQTSVAATFDVDADEAPRSAAVESGQESSTVRPMSARPVAVSPTISMNQAFATLETSPAPDVVSAGRDATGESDARLAGLERALLDDDTSYDAPDRRRAWFELARAYEAVGRFSDAALCAEQLLWGVPSASPEARASLDDWLRTARLAAGLSASTIDARDELAGLASRPAPSSAEALVVAATIVATTPIDALTDPHDPSRVQVGELTSFLERFESLMSVRAAWMAWRAVARRAGDDALMLARARDRLLERLHLQGLLPALDMPRFAETLAAKNAGNPARVGALLNDMARAALDWIDRELHVAATGTFRPEPTARTAALTRFAFAYGLAIAGDVAADALEQAAVADLDARDPAHAWLIDAFRFRIAEARNGRRATALPAALVERLRQPPLDSSVIGAHRLRAVTAIDQLRRQSRLLDPAAALATPAWRRADAADPLVLAARGLADIADRDRRLEAARAIRSRASAAQVAPPMRATVLESLLFAAPTLGAAFAAELLPDVASLVDMSLDPPLEIALWERALGAATSCDLGRDVADLLQRLPRRFERLFARNPNPQELEPLASLLGSGARGLRKLGLGDAARELADRAAESIRAALEADHPPAAVGRTPRRSDAPATALERRIATLALLLRLTPAWTLSGAQVKAAASLDEAEAILCSTPARSTIGATPAETRPTDEADSDAARPTYRHWLARSWCDAVASLEWDAAAPRLSRFFDSLHGIHRPTATEALYSAPLLAIVESAVVATLSDDLTVDPATRRLLDDSESAIRRTIHDDLRDAMSAR